MSRGYFVKCDGVGCEERLEFPPAEHPHFAQPLGRGWLASMVGEYTDDEPDRNIACPAYQSIDLCPWHLAHGKTTRRTHASQEPRPTRRKAASGGR